MTPLQRATQGGLAGLAAVVPMTMAMRLLQATLPGGRRRPLPPEQVRHAVMAGVGVTTPVPRRGRWAVSTWLSHLMYGATCGAAYGLMSRPTGARVKGAVAFASAVWAVSYLGWLPAAGLRRSAVRAPAAENVLMVVAHWVWGATTGWLMSSKDARHGG